MKILSVLLGLFMLLSGIFMGIPFVGFPYLYTAIGIALFLGVAYLVHTIIKDLKNSFNVDFELDLDTDSLL